MTDIKIVFVDIDGTLMDSSHPPDNYISPDNIKTIQEVVKKGVHICISSGRMVSNIRKIAELIGIPNEYIISFNGAMITRGNEVLYSVFIQDDVLNKLNKMIKEHEYYAEYYANNEYYCCKRVDGITDFHENRTNEHCKCIGNDVYELKNVQKLLIIGKSKEEKDEIKQQLDEIPELTAQESPFNYLDVTMKCATKGEAVKHLCNYLHINKENTMAIGDAYNDLPMLNEVGIPIIMGNAVDDLKKGREVTGNVRDGGVAQAIRKYCFK